MFKWIGMRTTSVCALYVVGQLMFLVILVPVKLKYVCLWFEVLSVIRLWQLTLQWGSKINPVREAVGWRLLRRLHWAVDLQVCVCECESCFFFFVFVDSFKNQAPVYLRISWFFFFAGCLFWLELGRNVNTAVANMLELLFVWLVWIQGLLNWLDVLYWVLEDLK